MRQSRDVYVPAVTADVVPESLESPEAHTDTMSSVSSVASVSQASYASVSQTEMPTSFPTSVASASQTETPTKLFGQRHLSLGEAIVECPTFKFYRQPVERFSVGVPTQCKFNGIYNEYVEYAAQHRYKIWHRVAECHADAYDTFAGYCLCRLRSNCVTFDEHDGPNTSRCEGCDMRFSLPDMPSCTNPACNILLSPEGGNDKGHNLYGRCNVLQAAYMQGTVCY